MEEETARAKMDDQEKGQTPAFTLELDGVWR